MFAKEPTNEIMPLAAIWLEKKVNGKVRFTDGDLIAVENGKMIENDHATHKIISCMGTVNSSRLEFILTDVISNEPSIFVIK